VQCAWGKRLGMKSILECVARVTVDLETLVWTRGKDFPISRLESRMRCICCGSRRVVVHIEAPRTAGAAAGTVALTLLGSPEGIQGGPTELRSSRLCRSREPY
jgi:hypothetical protein